MLVVFMSLICFRRSHGPHDRHAHRVDVVLSD